MSAIIDFHAHAFPDLLGRLPMAKPLLPALQIARRQARGWLKPFTASLHQVQTALRHVPSATRHGIDELSALLPIPGLLVESTPEDLLEAMAQSQVSHSVLIAAPPYADNDFVLETCKRHRSLIPAVNIPSGTPKAATLLKRYIKRGARILKIHAAADGASPQSQTYAELLPVAADAGLPVILHTGCIHSRILYKDSRQGQARIFEPWFTTYPDAIFVLAHMNLHDPNAAIDLAEEHRNVCVDTSWQPTEIIGEAVRRLGPGKVLFGSDWPLIGHNLEIGIRRIEKCIAAGMITERDAALIYGGNAARLLKFEDGKSL